jgi:hypothetical protein
VTAGCRRSGNSSDDQHSGINVRSNPENYLTELLHQARVGQPSGGDRAVNGSKNSNSVDADKRRDTADDETRR